MVANLVKYLRTKIARTFYVMNRIPNFYACCASFFYPTCENFIQIFGFSINISIKQSFNHAEILVEKGFEKKTELEIFMQLDHRVD